jgi:hypothetical protein
MNTTWGESNVVRPENCLEKSNPGISTPTICFWIPAQTLGIDFCSKIPGRNTVLENLIHTQIRQCASVLKIEQIVKDYNSSLDIAQW